MVLLFLIHNYDVSQDVWVVNHGSDDKFHGLCILFVVDLQ